MRTTLIALAFALLLAQSSFAAKVLHYSVDLHELAAHRVHVTLVPSGFSPKFAKADKHHEVFFQMPVWAPGAYSETHYGRYVSGFCALDKAGDKLVVRQVSADRWAISDGRKLAKIAYDVKDSHHDSLSLYFAMAEFDSTHLYANATTLFGYYNDDKSASAEVTYAAPDAWKIVCPLPHLRTGYTLDTNESFLDRTFYATDYDVLADAPIMASPSLVTSSFREGSAAYDIALLSNNALKDGWVDSLREVLRAVVHAETDFFHDVPFKRYAFLVNVPTIDHMPSYAQGALEHANSSDYLLTYLAWPIFRRAFLSTFSHEFFHLWNVKRIHSSLLGPFDYTQRVKTTSLWLSEGVTEYYAALLLARSGIISQEEALGHLREWLHGMRTSPEASRALSLEELSIDESDFHLDNAMLFYTKGPLVALMLDLELRSRTNNKRSLDDVMLSLAAEARKGSTFSDDELIHKIEKIASVDLSEFYAHFIHGTDSLPLSPYFEKMGLALGSGAPVGALQLGATPDGHFLIAAVDPSSAFGRAGVKAGDQIEGIDGTKLTMQNVQLFSSARTSGKVVTFNIIRHGDTVNVPVDFSAKAQTSSPHRNSGAGALDIDPNATPEAIEVRRSILGMH